MQANAQVAPVAITIEAGDLAAGLRQFALTTRKDLIFSGDLVADKRTPGVSGATSEAAALETILAGTGLTYRATPSGGYAIVKVTRAETDSAVVTPEEAPELIIITGSRIRGLPSDGPVQAKTITRDEIDQSGAGSIIDILRDLPQTGGGSGTFSTSTAGPLSGATPVGAAGVSLRGLGTSATLTLINNRRSSVAAFARGQEGFIDANSIPLAAIERVDILPNGASALYGADAVAGVVNYVLRKDYKGAELSVSYGDSTAKTDEGRLNVTGVIGGKLGEHNLMLVADIYRRNGLYDRDRNYTKDSFRPSQQGFYPSFNDLYLMTNDQTESPQNGGCPADKFAVGNLGEYCAVDTNDYAATDDEYKSEGLLFTHNYKINDRTTWFSDVLYQQYTSQGTASPANFSRTPSDPQNPNYPASFKADLAAEGGVSNFSSFNRYPIYMWGKLLEPRAVEVSSKSYRMVSGLKHEFTNGWSMESALTVGGNERLQKGTSGLYRTLAFYDANLGNLCTDGSKVDRWRVNAARPDASYRGSTCEAAGKTTLWYNPFGGQKNQDPKLKDTLETTAERRGLSSLLAFDVSATGDLFQWNGRTVKGAFGAELRHERIKDTPSGDAVATLTNPEPILGFSSTSARGERNQWAAFGEIYLPLTDALDVQLAGRYDSYDDFGSDFNPKIAVRWSPFTQLVTRANWSTSFRAPSLSQSGAGVLLSSFRVRCAITPQACNNNAAATGQALLSEDVGNPDLEAETAESHGFGAVYKPTSGIEIGVDYWDIRHENLVGIDRDDFIRRALNGEFTKAGPGLLPTGTAGIEVSATGFVTDAHFQIGNLGYQHTRGIDLSYRQKVYTDSYGDFTFTIDTSYLMALERQASVGAAPVDEAGEYQYPQWLTNTKLRWRNGAWRASVSANYTSSYRDDPDPRTLTAVGLPTTAVVDVEAWLVVDADLSYDLGENSTLGLNIQNLSDEDAPRVLGSGANVDHINHDTRGRFVTVRYKRRF
ncbi:hypothetical protein ABAC402_14980 [Asticcacaulis sp. AC402]|nr:hypothetical protein ABAC402_14980 [Asticcacaulis sp. AC402]